MMNPEIEKEEKLRESACIGDLDQLKKLVETDAVNINAQNTMNGWTSLHWACKRNHTAVVKYLLSKGADKNIQNSKKELPAQLTNSAEIRYTLEYSGSVLEQSQLAIQPSYLKYPVFPYNSDQSRSSEQQIIPDPGCQEYQQHTEHSTTPSRNLPVDPDEIVLKARVAYGMEKDFIEVEISRNHMTYENLMSILTKELAVERHLVYKIRKLPNTILRKDKDVRRLVDYQELELVLTNKAMSSMSRSYGDVSDGFKHEQILY
ncbi:Ankyrin repeat domain-containing protein 40 [Mactra antiquata]